jgi:alpha,alpha-trehalose phosphorylase
MAHAADGASESRGAEPEGRVVPLAHVNGEEASAYYAAGTAQYHINAAVAWH